MIWVRRAVVALVVLGLLGLIALAFVPKPVKVEVGAVARAPLAVTVDGTGKARVKQRYVVSAPVAGQLARIALRAGDPVGAGQEVARIAPITPPLLDARTRTEVRARLAAARAAELEARSGLERVRLAHAQSERDLQRDRRLAAERAIPVQKLEAAELEASARAKELAAAGAAAERARREAEALRATLAGSDGKRPAGEGRFVAVAAPTAGRVLRVLQENEGPVQPGTPLLEVGDPADLEVVVDLLTTQAVRVKPGAAVELWHWGGGTSLRGVVTRVEPSAFTKVSALGVEEQRVNVVIEPGAARAGWSALSDGYHVEARVVVWASPGVVTAPAGALFRRGDAWSAFAVVDGKAVLRRVEVGEQNRTHVEVKGGLALGDRLVIHPGDKVVPGVALQVD